MLFRNMEIYGKYMANINFMKNLKRCFGCTKLDINGNGNNFLDAMYIDDYIDIIIELMVPISNETIDICKSNPVTVKELINTIYSVVNRPKQKINFYRIQPKIQTYPSNSRCLACSKHAKISLETGLKNG